MMIVCKRMIEGMKRKQTKQVKPLKHGMQRSLATPKPSAKPAEDLLHSRKNFIFLPFDTHLCQERKSTDSREP